LREMVFWVEITVVFKVTKLSFFLIPCLNFECDLCLDFGFKNLFYKLAFPRYNLSKRFKIVGLHGQAIHSESAGWLDFFK